MPIFFSNVLQTMSAYTLYIEARDMGGEEFGLYTTAAVHIEIEDVNDNLPQVAQSMVSLS